MNTTRRAAGSPTAERAVAILFEPEGEWSLSAIEGIADFARRQGGWRLLCVPRDDQGRLEVPPGWKGNGILTRLLSQQERTRCLSYGLPVVDLEAIMKGRSDPKLAHVITNNETRAQLVIEHLLTLKLHQFACFNPPHQQYAGDRLNIIKDELEERGLKCDLFWKSSDRAWRKLDWERQQELVKTWLSSLPPRTGLVAPDGRQGRLLSEWCHFLDIRIPDDLAMITCDDDGLLSSIASTPLSGVLLAAKQHGYAAAELLNRMMDGAPAPKQPVLIDPLHVVIRQSTDFLKLDNPEIVRAVRYIRENASAGIRVSDVANHLAISRRSLEQLFHSVVGHTVGHEIRKARFDKAKSQLSGTEMSVEEIAASCGFSAGAHLCRSFRQTFGETPLNYRRRSRP